MTRRILIIGLAVVLAALGAVGVLVYVHRADQRALAGMHPVEVLVATAQIPAGTSAETALRDGWLKREQLPASSVPSDAVKSITSANASLVTATVVPSGQLLLSPVLVASTQVAVGLPVPSGMVAVTIPFSLPRAVAYYIHAGSYVGVFNTYSKLPGHSAGCAGSGSTSGSTSSTSSSSGARTRLVLAKVLVLSVTTGTGQSPTSATATSADSGRTPPSSAPGTVYVTVAVSQADAERLIDLTSQQDPYLALVTSTSRTKADFSCQP